MSRDGDNRGEVRIARRFRGPPDSGNGGYVCGVVASRGGRGIWSVCLLRPPPLDVDLSLLCERQGQHEVVRLLRSGGASATGGVAASDIAEGTRVDGLEPPELPAEFDGIDFDAARDCATRYAGWRSPGFSGCFVCGIDRAPADGLRIFAGPLAGRDDRVAAPWVPDASLDDGRGDCAPEFVWAALDCPGYFAAVPEGGVFLLAEMTAWVARSARIGERCVALGWALDERRGRKRLAATAILGADGEPIAFARQLWIQPRSALAAAAAAP